jgi:hypothetical protein
MSDQINRNRKTRDFTVLNNKVLQDKRLSWKARGILAYIFSLPNDWKIYKSELEQHSDTDGRISFENGFKELMALGYIIQTEYRNEKKQIQYSYEIFEEEQPEAAACFLTAANLKAEKLRAAKLDTENLSAAERQLQSKDLQSTNEQSTNKQMSSSASNAHEDEIEIFPVGAKQEGNPKPPVAPAPLPLTQKRIYGDGRLQEKVREFHAKEPEIFTSELCRDFLVNWTAPVLHSDNPQDVGQELWKTHRVFPLEKRLRAWYQKELVIRARDESATSHTKTGRTAGPANRTGNNGYKKPAKRTPVITPEHLRRPSPDNGNSHSHS